MDFWWVILTFLFLTVFLILLCSLVVIVISLLSRNWRLLRDLAVNATIQIGLFVLAFIFEHDHAIVGG